MTDWRTELPNECCRDEAVAAAKRGDNYMAMRWYNTARARTIGHKKSDAYDYDARMAAEAAKVKFSPGDYAKDEEAIVHAKK